MGLFSSRKKEWTCSAGQGGWTLTDVSGGGRKTAAIRKENPTPPRKAGRLPNRPA
ncbi:hypothetical protein Cme02nite_37900 [Catellatospora methionotrophica]|uniref:Uncharacterized protein n=1 Tax=Catellatospora methionotrophica TaxID=121620 RepID=A0A8J3L6R8_9ACTN|nr:hypothetical protein Cme02nite_37900 [Catellatospora methionotrophica]